VKIKELTIQEFEEFAKTSPLNNYMQSVEYARFMGEHKYNYDYLGLIDDSGTIKAASLILRKKISLSIRYGYAPKGFLLNYYDEKLVKIFIEKVKEFYAKKNMAFIKINPEIVVAEIDNKTYEKRENPNMQLKQRLQNYGFIKLKDNLYFESLTPRFNVYIDLKNANDKKYAKSHRNKVRNSKRKGLFVEKDSDKALEELYDIMPKTHPISYYKTMQNLFKDDFEIILVRVNFENFIKNSQSLYEQELDKNGLYNEILHRSNKEADLNQKMASDAMLCTIKNEIITATEGLKEDDNKVVAGAIIIKRGNRVHIIESAFDRKFTNLNANYFLYDALINNYKTDYEYLDLNGISGDFKSTSPYRNLNRFKLGFSPKIYEYIGEFDLVLNNILYDNLLITGKLAQEFNKN